MVASLEDYSTFSRPSFDANEYANAVLAGESYSPAKSSIQPLQSTLSRNSLLAPPKTPLVSSSSAAGQEDISVALAKLNFGIDDVSKQLRGVIETHHEELLTRAAGVHDLETSLQSVRHGLDTIGVSLEKLKTKIRTPHQALASHLSRLQRLQVASDALRRISRVVTISKRLESQMTELDRIKASPGSTLGGSSHRSSSLQMQRRESIPSAKQDPPGLEPEGDVERVVAQAALYIAELSKLTADQSSDLGANTEDDGETDFATDNATMLHLEPIDLRSVNIVSRQLSGIESARTRVQSEMENMVMSGLDKLNQPLLASALQTAFNLRVLPSLVLTLLADLNDAVEARVRLAFDMTSLSKEVGAKDTSNQVGSNAALVYRSRVRTEPTNITTVQWATALWARLEVMIEDMARCCIKVYTLERVLRLKKDTATQVSFLDDVLQTLENKPSSAFWASLAVALERYSKEAATGSTFLQQTLSNGYPRFLRMFHDFFAKIAVHTDTVYIEAHQSPETILVLRSISRFETVYLSRSTTRLNEAIATALSGGIRSPPAAPEGLTIARVAENELDGAKFDVLLVRSVGRNVVSAIDVLLGRMNTLISRDRMTTLLTGPNATPPQVLNSQLASTLYTCWAKLKSLEGDYPSSVVAIISPTIKNVRATFDRLVDPLISAIHRDLASIIARLHRVDFGSSSSDPTNQNAGEPSGYMKDLLVKLDFVRTQILARYSVGELNGEWALSIVRHVVRTFIFHASITRPLGEMGKLQLTTDMTALEFALSAFMVIEPEATSPIAPGSPGTPGQRTTKNSNRSSMRRPVAKLESIGDEYRALRGLRQLLFLDTAALSSPTSTQGLPPLIVVHHIIVRSSHPVLALPHALQDPSWSEAEYVRWAEEHAQWSSREAGGQSVLKLIESCLSKWEAEVGKWIDKNGDGGDGIAESVDYVHLIRSVLDNARMIKQ